VLAAPKLAVDQRAKAGENCQEPVQPLTVVDVRAIGVIQMRDDRGLARKQQLYS
jgi:hypothetical protein